MWSQNAAGINPLWQIFPPDKTGVPPAGNTPAIRGKPIHNGFEASMLSDSNSKRKIYFAALPSPQRQPKFR
jgi:hypothetical protein